MKTTPLISAEMQVVPHRGKYSLCENRGTALWESVRILDRARPVLEDYKQLTGFGQVNQEIRAILVAIERFAAERERTFATGDDWRGGK